MPVQPHVNLSVEETAQSESLIEMEEVAFVGEVLVAKVQRADQSPRAQQAVLVGLAPKVATKMVAVVGLFLDGY